MKFISEPKANQMLFFMKIPAFSTTLAVIGIQTHLYCIYHNHELCAMVITYKKELVEFQQLYCYQVSTTIRYHIID